MSIKVNEVAEKLSETFGLNAKVKGNLVKLTVSEVRDFGILALAEIRNNNNCSILLKRSGTSITITVRVG